MLTGHADGIITINIEEANDSARERIASNCASLIALCSAICGTKPDTIIGIVWSRSQWLDDFRALFGDEREDYAAALQRNYQQGPMPGWAQQYVSAYASVIRWRIWRKPGHYLHIVDVLDTALSFGLDIRKLEMEIEPSGREALFRPHDPGAKRFLAVLNAWIELTAVLNELSRSMGQADLDPFVLPRPAVAKLHFIHLVIAPSID